MPEFLPQTRADYAEFVKSRLVTKDPFERALMDIESALARAWQNNRCTACPIAELAALAAALRTLYQEQRRG